MGLASSRVCFAPRERRGVRITITENKPSCIQEYVIVGLTEHGSAIRFGTEKDLNVPLRCSCSAGIIISKQEVNKENVLCVY